MATFHGRTGAVYLGQEDSVALVTNGQTLTIADNAAFDFGKTDSFTLELWATISATANYHLTKDRGNGGIGWDLEDIAGELSLATADKGNPTVSLIGLSYGDSLPHQFVFSRNITTTKLYAYQDGAFIASSASFTTASDLSNTSDIIFQTDGGDWYMQQFRIYNKALTVTEVSDAFLGERVAADNIVGDWRATEGRGNLVFDSSGNERVGTLSSANMWDKTHAYGTVATQPCTSNVATRLSWTVSNVATYPNIKITSVAQSDGTAIGAYSFTTNGKILLKTAPTDSFRIKATFKYYPAVNFALGFHNWSADLAGDAEETTVFGLTAPYPRSYIPGLTSWSGSAEKYLKVPECEGMVGTEAIVKLFLDESTNYRWEGWGVFTGVSPTTPVDAVVTETVNFQGTGALEVIKG